MVRPPGQLLQAADEGPHPEAELLRRHGLFGAEVLEGEPPYLGRGVEPQRPLEEAQLGRKALHRPGEDRASTGEVPNPRQGFRDARDASRRTATAAR